MSQQPDLPSPSNRSVGALFLFAGMIYILGWLFAEGFHGGGDTITHFQIAKYCWDYEYLLIDMWGKPMFTIPFSIIAPFGLKAVEFVNIILIFWGAWLTYLISLRLQLKHSVWVAFFMLFTPIIISNSYSALTEPICALFLIGFLYFAVREKWAIGSFVIGFMPFARSEGFVILLLVLIYYFISRKWRFIPLLMMGCVSFALVGYIVTSDWLWLIAGNPYINAADNHYGSGSFWHFFIFAIPVFGLPFLLTLIYPIRQPKLIPNLFRVLTWSNQQQVWFFLIMGSFWSYFLAHTVLWWLGMWASLGLTRVMFVIVAPMTLMAMKCWEDLAERKAWFQGKAIRVLLISTTLAYPIVLATLFQEPADVESSSMHQLYRKIAPPSWPERIPYSEAVWPPQLGIEERVNVRLIDTLNAVLPEYKRTTCFTSHPFFNFLLDRDPYDTNNILPLYDWKKAQPGQLIFWDGHYAPNELGIQKEELFADTTIRFLFTIHPPVLHKPLNDIPYEIAVFQKK